MQIAVHNAFALTTIDDEAIICIDGQFCIYSSMQVAAHMLGVLAKNNPRNEFTIREFRIKLPWTERGF